MSQFSAIFIKKMLTVKRDRKFYISGVFFPFIMVFILILIASLVKPSDTKNYSEKISMGSSSIQSNLIIPFTSPNGTKDNDSPGSRNETSFSGLLGNIPSQRGIYPLFVEMENTLNVEDNLMYSNESGITYLTAVLFNGINYLTGYYDATIMYNTSESTIQPMMMNMIGNAILKNLTGKTLEVSQRNFPGSLDIASNIYIQTIPILLEYGFVFMAPLFTICLIIEKEKKLKQHMMINSLNQISYWSATFIADFITFLIPAFVCIIALFAAQIEPFIKNFFLCTILLFVCFGWASVPFGYIFGFLFASEETANKFLYTVMSIATIIPYMILQVAFANNQSGLGTAKLIISIIYPPQAFYEATSILCSTVFSAEGPLTFSSMFSFKRKFIIYLIINLAQGIVYLAITIIIETNKKSFGVYQFDCKNCCKTNQDIENQFVIHQEKDVDVLEEEKKVASLLNKEIDSEDYSIIVSDILKTYPSLKGGRKTAVNKVSLAIKKRGVFGLLGVNGAGKSSLLNILTGTMTCDSGSALVSGFDIFKDRNIAFKNIGYCPQDNVLFDLLTVKEHLELYSRIRGVNDMRATCSRLIDLLELKENENKLSSDLSGGNKRKLMTAISLIGDAKVIFLDEPSSGMSVDVRKKLWEVIDLMKKDRVIILTTHSMEEAEICDKIGVLVSGQFRCMGTPQQLKTKYGQGYVLSVQFDSSKTEEVGYMINKLFPDATLQIEIEGLREYKIPQDNISLGKVFAVIEENKEDLKISDYSLCQQTLEQVFIKFAKEQEENDEMEKKHIF